MRRSAFGAMFVTLLMGTITAGCPAAAQPIGARPDMGPPRTAPPNARPPSGASTGQFALRERQRKCGAEWREAKTKGMTGGLKWPQFWSACNKRMKGESI